MTQERVIDTDILVIGGGMAGFFAAIKAKEQGLDVTLTDKAYAGKAGSTHFSEGDIVYFRPDQGHNLKEWVDLISQRCEYVNNREWDEICLKESEDRYNDLASWGVPFFEKDGKTVVFTMMNMRTVYKDVTMVNRKYAPTLRKTALENGVRVLDRIMFCELLKQDGQIVGAVGFNTISGNLYIFKAKAVVIATGSSSLKAGSYPVFFWTGDGEAMAYRVGTEIVSKEFMYGMPRSRVDVEQQERTGKTGIYMNNIVDSSYRYPFALTGGFTGWYNRPDLNAEGRPVVHSAWEAHCGRAPLYVNLDSYPPERLEWLRVFFKRIEMGRAQAEKIGLDIFKGGKVKWPASRVMTNSIFAGSGIWPVNKSCATAIPGLYAAGNSCGTMASGATYGGGGFGSNHAMVTGTRAGLGAAEYVTKLKEITLDQAELKRIIERVCAPMERKGGFGPDWLIQALHGVTVPYYFLDIKHEKRLKAALTIVEFMKSHLAPKLMANDAHEWRLSHEAKNLLLIAEMRLRASLFRTESRGNHFREDYPRRDDPNWLAWVKLKDDGGEMNLTKEPIPKEWWPDLSKSYEERYPNILPME
jgi:succinate dehydrogenase/fumarate reductase flavoprotein subunit